MKEDHKNKNKVDSIETVRILEMEVETKKTELKHLRQKIDLLTSKEGKFEELENKYKEEILFEKNEVQKLQSTVENLTNEINILQI